MAQAITNLLTPSFKPSTSVANFLPTTTTPAQSALNNKTTGISSSPSLTGNSQVSANQAAAAKLGITLPGVGGGSSIPAPQSQPVPGLVNPNPPVPAQAAPPTPTYAGLVTQIANQQNTPNNQAATQSAQALQGLAATNPATSGPAFDAYTKSVADQNTLKQGIAKQYANVESNPIPLEFQQGREQVMGRQYASQLDAGQQAINQQQAALGYQISGQQTQNAGYSAAGGLANSTQGLAQSALGTAAGLAAPQGYGLTTQPYNPLTDTFGGGGTNGAIDRATQAGNISSAQGFAQDYNAGKAQLAAADGIQNQIVATLQGNPTLNNTPVSALTNLNELLSGQVSSGPQQLLSQQIAQYISTLGLDPASVANIAHQQKGTLSQLLDSLRQTAQTINESKNPANLKTGSSTGSSNNGQITWDNIL